jgi:hypothetical protein
MLLDGKSSFNLKIPPLPSAPSAPHRYTVYSSTLYTLLSKVNLIYGCTVKALNFDSDSYDFDRGSQKFVKIV